MCCGFNNVANEARNFVELNDNGCSCGVVAERETERRGCGCGCGCARSCGCMNRCRERREERCEERRERECGEREQRNFSCGGSCLCRGIRRIFCCR